MRDQPSARESVCHDARANSVVAGLPTNVSFGALLAPGGAPRYMPSPACVCAVLPHVCAPPEPFLLRGVMSTVYRVDSGRHMVDSGRQ